MKKKNFKIILLTAVLILCFGIIRLPANATTLPQPIVEYLKSKFPDVAIRFDGLIELPDRTTYLPVMPLTYGKVDNPAAVVQTIPAKTDFSKKPDMILFANNLALLKLVSFEGDKQTVNYSPQIPLSVKLGLLPQDLIVPKKLALPTELKVIMGNLKIAVIPKKDEDDLVFFGNPEQKPVKQVSFINGKAGKNTVNYPPELDFIKHKVIYAADFKENKINIIDSATGRIVKNMKLPSVPSNMVLTNDDRYLLVTSMSLNKLFVIDTFTDLFLKDLDIGKYPSSILLPKNSQKAYVANRLSSSITEIDLENMVFTREIKAVGNPDNLISTDDNQNIIYNDTGSGNIYKLNLDSGISKKVIQVSNISKIALHDNCLYILNRSDNELVVYNLKENKEITKVKVGEKPVDIQIVGNKDEIYVLAAGSDEINIINMKELKAINTIALNSGGFPNKITVFEKENRALITNQDSYQITILDLNKQAVIGNIPISKNISFIQVSK